MGKRVRDGMRQECVYVGDLETGKDGGKWMLPQLPSSEWSQEQHLWGQRVGQSDLSVLSGESLLVLFPPRVTAGMEVSYRRARPEGPTQRAGLWRGGIHCWACPWEGSFPFSASFLV